MSPDFDVVVCGLGATGSATLFHLSRAGVSVCGIDRFDPPHTRGSSHGQSRIIRQAYHEHPVYVPLVQRAWSRWEALQAETHEKILEKTGGIMLGDPEAGVIRGTAQSAAEHRLPVTRYDNDALRRHFPAFRVGKETVGIMEENAGILFPEACIRTFLSKADASGAAVRVNETVVEVAREQRLLRVRTDKATYHTRKLVLSAGPWMPEILPELKLPLTVERQVLYWFTAAGQSPADWSRLPIFIWEYAAGKLFYGFRDLGDGIKVARHHQGLPVHPDGYDTIVHTEEIRGMTEMVSRYLHPEPRFLRAETCLYSNTPDEHFILDHHPQDERIIVASPCSGHGFKFASYIGELLAKMAMEQDPGADIRFFGLERFREHSTGFVK